MHKTCNKIYFNLLLLLAIAILPCTTALHAQNNPYGIDDGLYSIYERAYAIRRTPQAQTIADSLFAKAGKMKDYKAQALALCIPLYYHYVRDDEKQMRAVVDEILKFSDAHNLPTTYGFASVNYVSYLLNHNHSYVALEFVEKWKNYAKRTGSRYQQFFSRTAAGNISLMRHEYRDALRQYREALPMSEGLVKPHDISITLYCRMAECCNFLHMYDDAIKYAQKGAEVAKKDEQRLRNLFELAIAYYHTDRRHDFFATYKKIEPHLGVIDFEKHRMNSVVIINCLLLGEYDKAVKIAERIPTDTERYSLLMLIYQRKGDYITAVKYQKALFDSKNVLYNHIIKLGIADKEMLNGSYEMQLSNRQMQIENNKMKQQNAEMRLKSAQSAAEAERMNAERSRLSLKHKQLEEQELKAAIDNKNANLKAKAADEADSKKLTLIIIVVAAILLTLILIHIIYHAKMSKRIHESNVSLEEQNHELDDARERSRQAEKMKTMFIQNMSHEIRTPLNAIVGFSQVLAEDDNEYSMDEKQDFSQRIEENSELILNIINDILDLSSISSGHYKMSIAPARANGMCKTALFAVKNRVPEGVELKFSTDVADDFQLNTDAKRVVQVIINFLTNAIKNTPSGSIHLHCGTTEHEGYVAFSVTDTGCGVAPEKMDLIFKRFQKLDDFKQGTGLGLSICSSITDRLGGMIYIDKTYISGGARFVFAIPVNTDLPQEAEAAPTDAQ